MAIDGRLEPYREVEFPSTHAARQLLSGKWTSKLGRWQDVEHELEGLVCDRYGTVKQVMKRAIEVG
jgi:hypothetical protein